MSIAQERAQVLAQEIKKAVREIKAAEARVKALNKEIEALNDELVQDYSNEGIQNMVVNGRTAYLNRSIYSSLTGGESDLMPENLPDGLDRAAERWLESRPSIE